MALTDDAVVGGGVLSSGLVTPKLKPLLLSVLDDPVPNTTPLVPNLNSEAAAGWSDVFSSFEEVPNLKPSEEPPNLKPEEAALS